MTRTDCVYFSDLDEPKRLERKDLFVQASLGIDKTGFSRERLLDETVSIQESIMKLSDTSTGSLSYTTLNASCKCGWKKERRGFGESYMDFLGEICEHLKGTQHTLYEAQK